MIHIEAMRKKLGNTLILDDFSMTLEKGKVTAFLGPSGSGKTTLLRLLAGLEIPDGGGLSGMPSEGAAVVFQDQRVIPWLTVEENIAFVLPETWATERCHKAVEESLEITRLLSLSKRYPGELSGGQASRIDLARALASGRSVVLLDEPFKGLDLELKLELITDFVKIAEQSKLTALFVTHDLDEALLVADSIWIVEGPPLTLTLNLKPPIDKKDRFIFDPGLTETRNALYQGLVKKRTHV